MSKSVRKMGRKRSVVAVTSCSRASPWGKCPLRKAPSALGPRQCSPEGEKSEEWQNESGKLQLFRNLYR